jgi:hypothetical protein
MSKQSVFIGLIVVVALFFVVTSFKPIEGVLPAVTVTETVTDKNIKYLSVTNASTTCTSATTIVSYAKYLSVTNASTTCTSSESTKTTLKTIEIKQTIEIKETKVITSIKEVVKP